VILQILLLVIFSLSLKKSSQAVLPGGPILSQRAMIVEDSARRNTTEVAFESEEEPSPKKEGANTAQLSHASVPLLGDDNTEFGGISADWGEKTMSAEVEIGIEESKVLESFPKSSNAIAISPRGDRPRPDPLASGAKPVPPSWGSRGTTASSVGSTGSAEGMARSAGSTDPGSLASRPIVRPGTPGWHSQSSPTHTKTPVRMGPAARAPTLGLGSSLGLASTPSPFLKPGEAGEGARPRDYLLVRFFFLPQNTEKSLEIHFRKLTCCRKITIRSCTVFLKPCSLLRWDTRYISFTKCPVEGSAERRERE
jgi:hypothetical protein